MTYEQAIIMMEKAGFNDMPIIDIHCHIGGYGRHVIPDGGSARLLIGMMDRLGIRLSMISHLAALTGEASVGNKLIVKTCAQYPGRIYGYLVYNPNSPPNKIAEEVESLIGCPGIVGLKFHSTLHGAHPNDERYAAAYELALMHKLPILMHIWGTADVYALDAVCGRNPEITVIAGHAGGSEWSDVVAACAVAKHHENLYLDPCISVVREGQIEYMVEKCSADRIVYGSDASFFCPIAGYGRLLFAKIGREEKRKILFQNAREIFREYIQMEGE